MGNSTLREKKCIPCQGGVPPLLPKEVDKLSREISSAWKIENDHKRLCRSIKTKNFADSMKLANLVGNLSEEQWHHPELHIGFGHLDIELWTHKINGLVESDFILASKIDKIFEEESALIL